jgi:hypothetical protein
MDVSTPPQLREGPIPAPTNLPSPTIYNPFGDNSAPPAIQNPTPPTKNEVDFVKIFSTILYFIFSGIAIYYGWTLGQKEGREYLLYVQSFGPWLRSWFVRPV